MFDALLGDDAAGRRFSMTALTAPVRFRLGRVRLDDREGAFSHG
jgi:hypothetical protein